MEFSPEAIQKFEAYINDWCYFARDYLRVNLDEEQEGALRAIQYNPKVTIVSGTSRGKDYLMAVAALCFLYLTVRWDDKGNLVDNTKVVLTAPTARQVREIMMPEVARVFKNSVYLPGELTGFRINMPYEEWFLTAFKADSTNTESWTGFHAVNIFFGVTEASGMAQLVFDAIEGNLQGNSRLVLASNPNINHGYAADAMNSKAFTKIRLNSLNAPNVKAKRIIHPGQVDYQWVVDRITEWCYPITVDEKSLTEGDFEFEGSWYRPNDLFRSKVLGLYPKVSEGVLVPPEWVDAAFQRWKDMQVGNITTPSGISGTPKSVGMRTKPLRLGVDVAGMGRDNSSFCYRFGNYVDRFATMSGKGQAEHMQVAGIAINTMKQFTDNMVGLIAQSFIDTIGEGAGTYSRIRELETTDPEHAWLKGRYHSCKFSEKAEWNDQPLKDMTGQYEFLNMRAYLYWAVRDWLNPANKNGAAIPEDEEIKQDLTQTRWKFMSNGKIQIESKEDIKKRLKRSPDKGDALANTFYPAPDIDPRPAKKQNIAQYFH